VPLNYGQVACLRHFNLMENLVNREGKLTAINVSELCARKDKPHRTKTSLFNVRIKVESFTRLFIYLLFICFLLLEAIWKGTNATISIYLLGYIKNANSLTRSFSIIGPSFTVIQKMATNYSSSQHFQQKCRLLLENTIPSGGDSPASRLGGVLTPYHSQDITTLWGRDVTNERKCSCTEPVISAWF
jgi:hypothetical protein